MIKKLSALFLVLLLCLTAVSCSSDDEDVPEGMQSATVPGEPFRLYVPESWSLNTSSGISAAYYSSSQKVMVTARYYTPADPSMSLDAYVDLCAEQYAGALTGFEITERSAALLGGENAVRITYKFTDDGMAMTAFQITAFRKGDMISLCGYSSSDLYENRSSDFNLIIEAFVLCDKEDPNGAEAVDKDTPEGMEIASSDKIEYRFYVPKAWICDAESGSSEAYYPESGKSNVTVTSFAPNMSISIRDYFAQCEAQYATTLPSYERLSEAERTVAGRLAYSYVYRANVDGAEFKIMQTFFTYNEMIYSITYTALTENFDTHLADVEAMLNAFTFR